MHDASIKPEELSAYVDGELSRTASAAVARAAARDPAVAAQIATLREMKAALGDLAPEADFALPVPRAIPRMVMPAAVAASLAVVVILAGFAVFDRAQEGTAGWGRALQAYHTTWSFAAPDAEAQPVIAADVSALLPLDLTAAKLTYTGHEDLEIEGRPVRRLGYSGTRGCRVSFYVLPLNAHLDPGAFQQSLLVRHWSARGHSFALMADGMAQARFAGLVEAVQEALRSGHDIEPATRQRLAKARRTSPPCKA